MNSNAFVERQVPSSGRDVYQPDNLPRAQAGSAALGLMRHDASISATCCAARPRLKSAGFVSRQLGKSAANLDYKAGARVALYRGHGDCGKYSSRWKSLRGPANLVSGERQDYNQEGAAVCSSMLTTFDRKLPNELNQIVGLNDLSGIFLNARGCNTGPDRSSSQYTVRTNSVGAISTKL